MSKTTNGIGWRIELYTKQLGWQPLSEIFDTAEKATEILDHIVIDASRENLRVYEVLKGYNDAI